MKDIDYIKIDENTIKVLDKAGVTNGKVILLFAKILEIAKNNGCCISTNLYFANLLCTTERNISTYIKMLKDAGVIIVESGKILMDKYGYMMNVRKIYPNI